MSKHALLCAEIGVDKIEEEEVAFEKQEGILAWRGMTSLIL
jgi:hypothetical protein